MPRGSAEGLPTLEGMPTPEQTRVFRRRRAVVAAAALAVLVAGGATIAWAVGQQDSAASGVPAFDTSGLSRPVAAQLEYAGHTDATWNRSVEWSITEQHPHGVAYYWSIPE